MSVVGRVCALAALLTGCAQFSVLQGRSAGVSKKHAVTISVLAPGVPAGSLSALEAYLVNVASADGYQVHTVRLEQTVPLSLLKRVFPAGAYSGISAISGGEVEGGAEVIEQLLDHNETVDAHSRAKGLARLTALLSKFTRADYHMLVHRFDTWSFATYVIRVSDNRIVGASVFMGNKKGFDIAMPDPPAGSTDTLLSDIGDASRLELLRMALFAVKSL